MNRPDLCLFVGEALVGNDSVDQLVKFNQVRLYSTLLCLPEHCIASLPMCCAVVVMCCCPHTFSPFLFAASAADRRAFEQALGDHTLNKENKKKIIDGIVLTKFDTVDDKVGSALSMVYTTGQPIIFVGVGQTYGDIRRLSVKDIVRKLLH